MDLKPIILALAAAVGGAAGAQINSPQSGGYLQRAAMMLADGNYQGCLDQCRVALELGDTNREQAAWLSAVAAFRGGLPEAGTLLRQFARQFPVSPHMPSVRLMLATEVFYEGDYPAALALFGRINPASLTDAEAEDLAYRTAFCMLKTGQDAPARELFERLEPTRRYGAASDFYLGYIAYGQGHYDSALQYFGRCDVSVAPGDMVGYYEAQIYFSRGEYAAAIKAIRPMLARKDMPEEFADEARRIMGECLYELGDDNHAMVYLNDYIRAHADSAPLSTRYIVGMERYQMGQYDDAVSLLSPVGELTDRMGQSALLTIGQSYMAMGKNKPAILAFNKAAELGIDPAITEMAYYNYAVAQVDGGRVPFGSSVRTLEDFVTRYPGSRYANQVREYLIKGYMATDDYEGALRSLNAYTGKPSDDILDARQLVNFMLGTRAANPDEAVARLEEALKYAGRNADIARQTRLWLGDARYAKGDYVAAQKQYQAFLASAPSADDNRPVAQYNLAYSLFGQRKYDEARTQFRSAESSRRLPADARMDCLNRIGDTYYYDSDFATAERTYADAAALNPSAADYSLYQIAMMQGHQGRNKEKIETIMRLEREFPSSPLIAAALIEKAMTRQALGDVAGAIAEYERVATHYPSTAQGRNSLLQLAIINANAGNEAQAVEFYRQVISRHPSSPEASLAVQDLKRIYGDAGRIEELNDFLMQTEGAPQLDAVERNAIAAASLLRTARSGAAQSERLQAALKLLGSYPDAEGAEEALSIAAGIEFEQGQADKALAHYTRLEQSASTAAMRHDARMGIIRSARDMGDYDTVINVTDRILASSVSAGADMPEVKFIRACAFADNGDSSAAISLWSELAQTPANVYGTRSGFELADYSFRRGNLDDASAAAEALIDANPPHAYWLARTYILYSDILRAHGAEYEANEYLRALQSNYPGSENDIFLMIESRLPQK